MTLSSAARSFVRQGGVGGLWWCQLTRFWSFQHAIDAMSAGVSPSRDTSYNSSYWDVGSAFFFAGTVITTIGSVFRYDLMDNSLPFIIII